MRNEGTPSSELLQVHRQIGQAVFVFSGRRGGVSRPPFASLNVGLHVGDAEEAVQENRRRVLDSLDASSSRLVEAEQVHGARVAVVSGKWLEEHSGPRCVASGADALVTAEDGVVLSLYFADCVPIFLSDRGGRVIGLAHAGWRGTAQSVAVQTLHAVCTELGAQPSQVRVVIGPCVGACCYEVGEEVVEAVLGSVPQSSTAVSVVRGAAAPGKWFLDLAAANAAQLRCAGVPEASIELPDHCTCCKREAFFSVRADGQTTGRCGAFAYIRAPAGAGPTRPAETVRY